VSGSRTDNSGWSFRTLWDMVRGAGGGGPSRAVLAPDASRPESHDPRPARERSGKPAGRATARRSGLTTRARGDGARAKYEALVHELPAKYGVRVRRWRTGMSGVAWEVKYRDGRIVRLIEAPRPKGPMSAAVFLHEIGHHAIGLGTCTPRCLEEYQAWMFALREMQARGLNITEGVRRRVRRSLQYAVDKARRRGIRRVPDELVAYLSRA